MSQVVQIEPEHEDDPNIPWTALKVVYPQILTDKHIEDVWREEDEKKIGPENYIG